MSVQTYNELITMPLGEIFKNITNNNSHNLFNQPLTINFLLNDPLLEKVEQNIQSIMALSNFY